MPTDPADSTPHTRPIVRKVQGDERPPPVDLLWPVFDVRDPANQMREQRRRIVRVERRG
jgi:hypothetical protein